MAQPQLLVTAHLLLNIQAHGVGGAQAEDGRLSTVSTLQLDTVSTLQLVMVTQAMCPAYVCPARGPATLHPRTPPFCVRCCVAQQQHWTLGS